MLLIVATALALALNTASTMLPATQPGLSVDEGVFLQTDADDGAKVSYFIAQGARHAILDDDLQAELRSNPLWPYRVAARDEVLAFPEGAPIGNATAGRLGDQAVAADDQDADETVAAAPGAGLAAAPGAEVAEPAPALTYTVQRGDTLLRIAARFGVSEADLVAANAIPNPDRVYVGQVLAIG